MWQIYGFIGLWLRAWVLLLLRAHGGLAGGKSAQRWLEACQPTALAESNLSALWQNKLFRVQKKHRLVKEAVSYG